jgi:parallel beta-helix repeat protein
MTDKSILRIFMVLVLLLVLLPPPQTAKALTYTVTTNDDLAGNTLRWAIQEANDHPGQDTIDFNIPDALCTDGVCLIRPNSPLPILTDNDGVIIDGNSQSINQGTDNPYGPEIEITGLFIPPIGDPPTPADLLKSGININSANNIIEGLVINNFPLNGISLAGTAAANNTIAGNCIGTDHQCAHPEANGGDGVFIGLGANNNLVGGHLPEEKNIILSNGLDGVGIHGSGTDSNVVSGNIIMSNDFHGVYVYGGAQNNTVGGDTDGERNLISGNHKDGVRIHGTGTNGNTVAGNYIGTASDGDSAIPNVENGVQITFGAQGNMIGGDTAGTGNLISGNTLSGVIITGTNTMSNTVSANYIGTYYDTSAGIPNLSGVQIAGGAQFNRVGGDSEIERNIISGNDPWGVHINGSGTSFNVVSGNYIGTDASGGGALANQDSGVYVSDGATGNRIGGITAGAGNLISGNSEDGIIFNGTETSNNYVIGNYIGTDSSGTAAIPNNDSGVNIIHGAHDNFIGGDSSGEGNLISGNGERGVRITGADTHSNTVSGNLIGTDWQGAAALGNTKSGVVISGGAYSNWIGGDTDGERNLVSGNGFSGVDLLGAGTINNHISGNYIGTTITGTAVISNTNYGVYVYGGATENLIGGQYGLTGNLISGNGDSGVRISGGDTTANTVAGNLIGLNALGDTFLVPYQEEGISIRDGAHHNLVGGSTAGAHNVVSGNEIGILISDTLTLGNDILGNYIGTDPFGTERRENFIGLLLAGGAQDNTIGGDSDGERNILSGNLSAGAAIINTTSTGNVLTGNYIGIDVSGTAALSNGYGVVLFKTASNVVGPNNVIAWNPAAGIMASGVESLENYFTRNIMYYNTVGISLEEGAHGGIAAPVIVDTDGATQITGTACAGCTVELFESFYGHGQGETFIGSTTADGSGDFSLTGASFSHNFLSATATDAALGTSEFSVMYTVNPMLYLPLVAR